MAGLLSLALLLAAQVLFYVIPSELILFFTHTVRPFAYAAALIVVCVFGGVDKRPIPKKRLSIMLAGFGAGFYFTGLLLASLMFGYGNNRMASGFSLFFSQVLTQGTVVVMVETLRHKLIRSTPKRRRNLMAVIVTLVFTFTQLDILRGISNAGAAYLLFSGILPTLALNATLSYIAFNGALAALMMLRFVYSLTPVFMPVLPNVSVVAWAVIECVFLLATVIMYHSGMSDKRLVVMERRRERHRKKSLAGYVVMVSLAVLLIAFNLRAFGYYPTVILTESMTGALERGSVVFVERLRHDEVQENVRQGDIILFQYGQIEVMHRVIEFRHNAAGERIFITKGDANQNADIYPVEMAQVLGISHAYIPYIGLPSVWLNLLFK